jgi:hypothetical protein
MIARLFVGLPALAFAVSVSAQQPLSASTADFSTARIAPGSWTYQALPGGSAARFIDSTGTARFSLECSKATRRVTISRTTSRPAASLFVWTTDVSRTIGVRFEPNAMRVAVDLAGRDPLLDGMAYSRGRIAIAMAGAEALVMPAWPEAARTIEDCRI